MSPGTGLNNNSEKLKLEISPFIGGPQGSLDKSIEAGNVYYQTFIATIARGEGGGLGAATAGNVLLQMAHSTSI